MKPPNARVVWASFAAVLALGLPARSPAATSAAAISVTQINNIQQATTPRQQALLEAIARRESQGLPAPAEVTFTYESAMVPGPDGAQRTTTIATTVIRFDGPAQAGLAQWPRFVIEGEVPPGADGFIQEGDYTEQVRQTLAERVPGIWDRYTFGYEPRTYTFRERFETTCSGPTSVGGSEPSSTTSTGDLLLGFTILAPHIHCHVDCTPIDECLTIAGEDVVCFKVGVEMNYGFGLRLPMELALESPETMSEGSTYVPTSSARGLDWAPADYAAINPDLAENGNEFVLRFHFFGGASLKLLGQEVSPYVIERDLDESRSFTVPLGAGTSFNLPAVDLPILTAELGICPVLCGSATLGFKLNPSVGSDELTADWMASGEASGAGALQYVAANAPVPVGPVMAIDGPGYANIALDNFRYHFTSFALHPELYVRLCGEAVLIGSACITPLSYDIPGIDLSAFVQGLSTGAHAGTPGSVGTSILIENVAPTAEVDRSGTVLVQGVPTFVVQSGEPLMLSGTARDPGRDDLTLSWDWDDGAPAPDVSTTYPVPHEVTESQTHAFGAGCLYQVGFKAVDDDLAFGEDHVPVLVQSPSGRLARLEGYWQHQLSLNGKLDFDVATLQCMLDVIGYVSAVFNEARDASTIQAAYDVLHLGGNQGSATERLDRELLVTLLNFAAGTFGLTESIDTDGDAIGDTPFVVLVSEVESVRLDPGATTAAIRIQTQMLHHLNAARTGAAAGVASAALGFEVDGSRFLDGADRFALVVMSVEAPEDVVGLSGAAADPETNDPGAATRRELLIDAGRIDPAKAFVGNEVGLLYPEEFLLADQNGDGLLDLTLVFSADQARALMNFWEEGNSSLAFRYEQPGGGRFVVSDIFRLGRRLPNVINLAGAVQVPAASGEVAVHDPAVDVVEEANVPSPAPAETRLSAVRPSPFHSDAAVAFDLARAGHVELEVFDLHGVRVRRLANGTYAAGHHAFDWNGRDERGHDVPAGIYLIRLRWSEGVRTQKVIRLN